MIKGLKYSGLTTDIWSAGVILFAMVCGYLPFEDNNTSELYDKIKSGKYKLTKCVSP
jgi:5'-AMP-activated protein kinase catalytic alpha subunit